MKKTIYLICFSLLGLGSVSCQKEKAMEIASYGEAIAFTARTPETKGVAPLNDLGDLAIQDFSVSAWYSPEGEEFGSDSKYYISNHRFGTLDGGTTWQGISKDGDTKSSAPVYYPLSGSLSFFSYAPFIEITEDSSVHIIDKPDPAITSQLTDYLSGSPLINYKPETDLRKQVDFVAASPVLNWEKENGLVPLSFSNHLTTRLRFYCNYTGTLNAEEEIFVTSIQLTNIIGSEYLYFTLEGDQMGYKWCDSISPEDGTANMPLVSYRISNDEIDEDDLNPARLVNTKLSTPTDASHPNFLFVNDTQEGKMYVLPQSFSPRDGEHDETSDPTLFLTYQIRNSEGVAVEENILKYDLRGTEAWRTGETVSYKITIGVAARKELYVTTVAINDWIDAENTQEPAELLY